jgi:hypothetical protein
VPKEVSAMAVNSLLANVHLLSFGRGTRRHLNVGGETIDETATFGTSAIPSPIKWSAADAVQVLSKLLILSRSHRCAACHRCSP